MPRSRKASPRDSASWAIFAVALAASGAAAVGIFLNRAGSEAGPDWALWWGWAESLQWAALMLLASFFGALVAPRNSIGRIFAVGGLAGVVALAANQFAAFGLVVDPGAVPTALLFLFVSDAAFMAVWVVLGVLIPLTFPTGSLLSRRWRAAAGLGIAGGAMVLSSHLLAPDLGAIYRGLDVANPLGVRALEPLVGAFGLGYFALFAGNALAVLSLTVRWIRSRGEERQQLKIVVYSTTISVVLAIVAANVHGILGGSSPAARILTTAASVGIYAIPVSMMLAVFRYRLYDIDVVINRTIVYVLLTVSLVAAYAGSVVVLQSLLVPITTGSDLSVVASTLLIAALFRPLRSRIQAFIDRRFYRTRYNAELMLQNLSKRLRDETDIDKLAAELEKVARDALQPTLVFLWTRPLNRSP